MLVSLQDVQQAHERIAPHTHYTPLLTNQTIDAFAREALFAQQEAGSGPSVRIAFKAEHLQRVGAFKYRGATNAVLVHLAALKEELLAGGGKEADFTAKKLVVVTHSSGNHAGALACAARTAGCIAAVVMPENAPTPKKKAVAGYGAKIIFCKPTLEARETTAKEVMDHYESEGYTVRFVHPYDERLVIAGQGTMALEMLDQVRYLEQRGGCSHAASATKTSEGKTLGATSVPAEGLKAEGLWAKRDEAEPAFDIIIAPVGGGGMLSGVSTAIKGADSRIVVIGAEPDMVDDAFHSLHTNEIQKPQHPQKTVCDGLLTSLSPLTLAHISKNVDTIATVQELDVFRALQLHWQRQKQLVEPSAAVGLAAVLAGHNEAAKKSNKDIDADLKDGKESDKSFWAVRHWANHIAKKRIAAGNANPEIRIGIIWSGGNVDVARVLAGFEEHGL